MYNLNVNVATSLPGFLGLDGQCNTPRTPEIVNSLVAMTNPFDSLMKPVKENSPKSEESYSGTVSPLSSPTSSPPSVQHTRSQLIKEGLKLTIQTKRKHSGSETKEELEEFESKRMKREELTEEDEERRKRRRERNKIAATKCRMKKREKTANLVNESEILEAQNIDLKTQIQDLQKQKRNLMDMLSIHLATCGKTPSSSIQSQTFDEFLGPAESYNGTFSSDSTFCPEVPVDFHVGSTNGAVTSNPYEKDSSFSKMLDNVPSSAGYTRSMGKEYDPSNIYSDSSSSSNYCPTKSRMNVANNKKVSGSRQSHIYDGKKKSEKDIVSPTRRQTKKIIDDKNSEKLRSNFHCTYHSEDVDSYKPNGIIDNNFFSNKTDIFATGNNYASSFGKNQLDNGCMA